MGVVIPEANTLAAAGTPRDMSLAMTTPTAPTGDVGHDFDPFAPDYLADPYPILGALRERAPVFYAPALDMWVVTRFAEIDEIFKNPARFSAANTQDPIVSVR